ncbi:MAG TPA: hydrogenase expression/formation protein HypE [Stellaceae bacterium]|nr:hydrogenase expression/formation protein HypE [Stellaceae bacterium]
MNDISPIVSPIARRRLGALSVEHVTLAHGGGKAMKDLIDDVFVSAFDNPLLAPLDDQARIGLSDFSLHGNRLAFTTDSYVVDPLFFPGGDIGKLAVCGTVNDLAVGGATPLYLSCAAIIEEGCPVELLRRVARSMAAAAREAGVSIVTGDTKVVQRTACDKLFLITSGVGAIKRGVELDPTLVRAGDAVLVNGVLGDHGATILAARGDLALDGPIESDCAPLNGLVQTLLGICPATRYMRDATRGGVATVLNEIAQAAVTEIVIDEAALPIREEVKEICGILGLDPLYLANEGKLVAIVPGEDAETALKAMRAHPLGRDARMIGRVSERADGRVVMKTLLRGTRIVDMLIGDQRPRIC